MAQSDASSSEEISSSTQDNEEEAIQWPKEKSQVTNMLECPVCTDFMTGIVQMCPAGHSMCKSCYDEILSRNGTCPMCRKFLPKNAARNYFLEGFAALCSFKCKFVHHGCPMNVEGHEFHNHITHCPFREYSCKMFNYLGHHAKPKKLCVNSSFSFEEFLKHLTETHSVQTVENGSLVQRSFHVYDDVITPSVVLIKYDSKLFFSYAALLPKGQFEIPTIFCYLINRWIIKVPEKEDLAHIYSPTTPGYSYKMITSYDRSQVVPKERNSLFLQLSYPNNHAEDTYPFVRQQEQAGKPLQFSSFPRPKGAKFTQEDDNSLFGFTFARGLRESEPHMFTWNEKITISKTNAESRVRSKKGLNASCSYF